MTNNIFGRNLKYLRKNKLNISQAQLGSFVGISGAYIQQLEKGLKTNPSFELILSICKLFNVSPMELLEQDIKEIDSGFTDFSVTTPLSEQIREKAKLQNTFEYLFKKPSEWDYNLESSFSLLDGNASSDKYFPNKSEQENIYITFNAFLYSLYKCNEMPIPINKLEGQDKKILLNFIKEMIEMKLLAMAHNKNKPKL